MPVFALTVRSSAALPASGAGSSSSARSAPTAGSRCGPTSWSTAAGSATSLSSSRTSSCRPPRPHLHPQLLASHCLAALPICKDNLDILDDTTSVPGDSQSLGVICTLRSFQYSAELAKAASATSVHCGKELILVTCSRYLQAILFVFIN